MFYLTTHSTHFIYGYMASDIWLRTILIVRKETRCRHIGYSYRLAARIFLYAPTSRQDSTYHILCYASIGALAGTRNSSMGPPSRIDPTTHRTMSERSYQGATSRSSLLSCTSTMDTFSNVRVCPWWDRCTGMRFCYLEFSWNTVHTHTHTHIFVMVQHQKNRLCQNDP